MDTDFIKAAFAAGESLFDDGFGFWLFIFTKCGRMVQITPMGNADDAIRKGFIADDEQCVFVPLNSISYIYCEKIEES